VVGRGAGEGPLRGVRDAWRGDTGVRRGWGGAVAGRSNRIIEKDGEVVTTKGGGSLYTRRNRNISFIWSQRGRAARRSSWGGGGKCEEAEVVAAVRPVRGEGE